MGNVVKVDFSRQPAVARGQEPEQARVERLVRDVAGKWNSGKMRSLYSGPTRNPYRGTVEQEQAIVDRLRSAVWANDEIVVKALLDRIGVEARYAAGVARGLREGTRCA